MPQIYVILSPATQEFSDADAGDLYRRLVPIVEKVFGIEGENDTAFTAIRAFKTFGEADVQIEIRYTAGEDEYHRGEPFEPTGTQQERLAKKISQEFWRFLSDASLPNYSLSVWCKPHRKGCFKMFRKSKRK